MRQKRRMQLDAEGPSEAGVLRERLRSDLERLGLAASEIRTVSRQLEPMLGDCSAEQYGALLVGVSARSGSREDPETGCEWFDDVAEVERLMHGVREEIQKLDEGLRMLSAYVTGLRRRSRLRGDDTLH